MAGRDFRKFRGPEEMWMFDFYEPRWSQEKLREHAKENPYKNSVSSEVQKCMMQFGSPENNENEDTVENNEQTAIPVANATLSPIKQAFIWDDSGDAQEKPESNGGYITRLPSWMMSLDDKSGPVLGAAVSKVKPLTEEEKELYEQIRSDMMDALKSAEQSNQARKAPTVDPLDPQTMQHDMKYLISMGYGRNWESARDNAAEDKQRTATERKQKQEQQEEKYLSKPVAPTIAGAKYYTLPCMQRIINVNNRLRYTEEDLVEKNEGFYTR